MADIDLRSVIDAMRRDDALRAELRALLLTEDVLRLPSQVASLTEAVRAQGEQLRALTAEVRAQGEQLRAQGEQLRAHTAILEQHTAELRAHGEQLAGLSAELRAFIAHTDRRFAAVERDLAELKGSDVEHRLLAHPRRYLSAVVRNPSVVTDLPELPRAAEQELLRADALVRGRRWDDGRVVWLVVEASWRAHRDDVIRARRRADLLAPAVDQPVVAVVFSRQPPGDRIERTAADNDVTLVVDDEDAPRVSSRALAGRG
jgi:hypothetical protein